MVCSVGVRYPNEPSPENAKLLVEVMVRQVVNGRLDGSVLERWWKNREVKKKVDFWRKANVFFLGGGDHLMIIWLPGLYIYICIYYVQYIYTKKRYMSCMHLFFECLPLDATARMRDVFFPC